MDIATWAVVGGALAVIVVAFRARAGSLHRQSLVGLRTKATMASDDAWRAAHEAVWPWLVIAASIMAVSGVLVLAVQPADDAAAAILLGGLAVAAVPFGIGGLRGQRAARDAAEDSAS